MKHFLFPSATRYPVVRSLRDKAGILQLSVIVLIGLCATVVDADGAAETESIVPAEAKGVPAFQKRVAVMVAQIYIGDGRVVENGTLLIADGQIVAIGTNVTIPDGATVITMDAGSMTPGLIDANARIESADLVPLTRNPADLSGDSNNLDDSDIVNPNDVNGAYNPIATSAPIHRPIPDRHAALPPLRRHENEDDFGRTLHDGKPLHVSDDHEGEDIPEDDLWTLAVGTRTNAVVNEQGSEVVPHIRLIDSVNFDSPDFERLVRDGVTTVYASPDASAVIGARGAILHTAGPRAGRLLEPVAAVKAVVGSEPISLGTRNRTPSRTSASFYARRPNSRMGLTWVFRKAFHDTLRRDQGLLAYGSDTPSIEATDVLHDVLTGDVPLRIQARIQQDIATALRLADEFNLRFTLEEATEAYRCLDALKARSVPIIFGPIYEHAKGIRLRSGEGRQSRLHTFRDLLASGIETSLSAGELREEDGLARQAMYAMRCGVTFDDALRAVTQTPAEMLGIDDELGTLEVGKRADLIVWSGRPFAATSAPLLIFIDGRPVVDRR